MHHEYAVEPETIGSSWENFRYLFEKFGFQNGRLISRFPKKWERLVIDAALAANVRDVAHTRIVEMLRQKKRTVFIRTGRNYDSELQSWLSNALSSHERTPFRAIIAQEECNEDEVVTLDELREDHPLMEVPTSRDIPRNAPDIAEACFQLLCAAREIDLVDPYFDLSNRGENYIEPLALMMQSLHEAGKKNVKIRIHYRDNDSRPNEGYILQNVGNWVDGIIPPGYELHLYVWQERNNGEDFHDRYLLCDCGGMMVGAGFAASRAQDNATFSLLDDKHVQNLRSRFTDGSIVYHQVGRTVRIKANGDSDLI